MKTAVDSSILLDLLLDDPNFVAGSRELLIRARTEGALIVCEIVVAEVTPALRPGELEEFFSDLGITFVPSTIESACLAGEMVRAHLERGGGARRVVPDFLIGAHAQSCCDRLLARDRGYFRDYFLDLEILSP